MAVLTCNDTHARTLQANRYTAHASLTKTSQRSTAAQVIDRRGAARRGGQASPALLCFTIYLQSVSIDPKDTFIHLPVELANGSAVLWPVPRSVPHVRFPVGVRTRTVPHMPPCGQAYCRWRMPGLTPTESHRGPTPAHICAGTGPTPAHICAGIGHATLLPSLALRLPSGVACSICAMPGGPAAEGV
jgi:hypothetical protein